MDPTHQPPLDPEITQGPGHPAPALSSTGSGLTNTPSTRNRGPQHVDALATVASEDNDGHLYGESSTIAFVRQVAGGNGSDDDPSSVPNREASTLNVPARANSSAVLLPLDVSHEKSNALAVLPLRRNADDYIHCYWEFIHPLFPLLHQPTFLSRYRELWLAESPAKSNDEELTFLCNLNLIFALGCQFSAQIPPNQRTSVADDFYKRSRHILLFDIFGSTSMSTVQWLLLSGIYLQSTSHADYCWNSIGLAIRHAQCIGLHLEHPRRKPETQVDLEMRRRVWHTCVVLDRLLGMTFGRPLMISTMGSTPIPSLIDDEYLRVDAQGIQPPEVHSRMGLFVYSCRLFEILADILSSFYGGHLSGKVSVDVPAHDMVSDVLRLNRRLDRFVDALPDYLQTSCSRNFSIRDKNSHINLQQQVLYCRFLYTRVLCLRPILLIATKTQKGMQDNPQVSLRPNGSSLDDSVVAHSCTLCIDTAHRLIETLHHHLDTTYRSSGWHSVYFTFASATVLLASLRLPESTSAADASFETSWNRCLSIMRHYEDQIHTAPYAVRVLETLRHQIQRSRSRDSQSMHDGLRDSDNPNIDNETTIPQAASDSAFALDLSQFNPYDVENLSDAWFTQQVVNLDCMDFGQIY